MYIYIHIYIHIYIYIYIHIYIYTYIYIYAYIHIYIHTLHYITLHYITLHYITLHYITLHYITLHTLHYITLHYITLHTYIHTYIYTYIYMYIPCYIPVLYHFIRYHDDNISQWFPFRMSLGSRLQRLQLGRLRAPGVLLMGSGGHRARSSRSSRSALDWWGVQLKSDLWTKKYAFGIEIYLWAILPTEICWNLKPYLLVGNTGAWIRWAAHPILGHLDFIHLW